MIENVPILIVDDLPQNILALEAVIADMGVDIITAQSGNDALRLSLKHDFALILLDAQMPGMNGFEVSRLIRANPKTSHFPIIFVTAGMKDLLDQIEGYETGAVDYLMKPFEPVILRSKVKVFRELYRQRKVIEKFYSNLEQIVEERTYELKKANETISRLAATDELTNLSNRRSFNNTLATALSAARRHEYPLSLIMIDLDHFKLVNDTFGHSEGDQVLMAFADLLREIIRAEDVAARWGGEEFIILLPHTPCKAASAMAERIRVAFEQYSRPEKQDNCVNEVAPYQKYKDNSLLITGSGTPIVMTASFGVVQFQEADDADALIRRADDALYKAKHEGRNRVVIG